MRSIFSGTLALLLAAGVGDRSGAASPASDLIPAVEGAALQLQDTVPVRPTPAGPTTSGTVNPGHPDVPAGEAPHTSDEHFVLDPHLKITKVHWVNNTESYRDGGNDALHFERDYWNFGAVTAEQKEARRGQIFLISWHKDGPAEDLTARFEYRQVNSKETVFVQTKDLPRSTGTHRTLFEVVGADYRTNGPIYSWRFTLRRGDRVVALERSYVW